MPSDGFIFSENSGIPTLRFSGEEVGEFSVCVGEVMSTMIDVGAFNKILKDLFDNFEMQLFEGDNLALWVEHMGGVGTVMRKDGARYILTEKGFILEDHRIYCA